MEWMLRKKNCFSIIIILIDEEDEKERLTFILPQRKHSLFICNIFMPIGF